MYSLFFVTSRNTCILSNTVFIRMLSFSMHIIQLFPNTALAVWLCDREVMCFLWGTNRTFTCYVTDIQSKTVSWLKRLFAGLSSRRRGFDPEKFHVMYEVVLGRGFPRLIGLPPLKVIPRVLHTHLQIHVAYNDKRAKQGDFQKAKSFRKTKNNT